MPKGHHRSRSSIDRVIDLLADLEESQITVLLDDLNHTTASNVPVSEAIALFENHASKTRRRYGRSPSPVRNLQAELERRHSKRISSAPLPRALSKTAYQPSSPDPQQPTVPQTPVKQTFDHIHQYEQPNRVDQANCTGHNDNIEHANYANHTDYPGSPSLTVSLPKPIELPKSPASPSPPSELRPRSYKRISRPTFLSPTATAELHLLLLAFFNDASLSTNTTATPSPTTPHFGSIGMSPAPFFSFDPEPEPYGPGLDLLEPEPTRTPSFSSSGRSIRTMPSMGSIFEVMRAQ
ncbi:hypothetical protein VTI74DRAFT_3234 [Chaetomium olivicolor]